jgi:aminoglycoside 2'-N-acetyltransferase I
MTDDTIETVRIRSVDSAALAPGDVAAIRVLLETAFAGQDGEAFTDDDWAHALGGRHVVLEQDDGIVGHAAVVERDLHIGDRPVRTGYVEAVAVDPHRQGRGLGSLLLELVNAHVRSAFQLGALATGRPSFYERLGWRTWRGPTSVRTPDGERRTPDEDGAILVLETPSTPFALDLNTPISCEWRPGDVW